MSHKLTVYRNFIFTILYIIIQLLNTESKNAHNGVHLLVKTVQILQDLKKYCRQRTADH